MKILRKAFGATAEAVEGLRQVIVTCSTAAVDRVGDVMIQAGIDVSNFARTKTVLWNHDQDRPIAKAVEIAIVDEQLRAVVEFPPEGISALADEIYGLIKAGVINAVSIGFQPLASEPRDGVNPKKGVVVTKSELLELSFVSVPANPQAEIMERSMAATNKGAPRVAVKSLYDLGTLVYVIQLLGGMAQDATWEADYEGDDSDVPGRLAEACRTAGAILVDMTTEEVGEFLARVAPEVGDTEEKRLAHLVVKGAISANAARAELMLTKAGRTFSAKSKGTLGDACKAILAAHDTIKAMVDEAEAADDASGDGAGTKAAPIPVTKNDNQDRRRRLTRLLASG